MIYGEASLLIDGYIHFVTMSVIQIMPSTIPVGNVKGLKVYFILIRNVVNL